MRASCSRVPADELERRPVLVGRPLAPQSQLDLGGDPRERRAQLVRELGREAALVAQARGDPVEHRVERAREQRQLVVRLARLEAAVEVVLAPGRGLLRHLDDGPERRLEQPPGGDAREHEHDRGQDERAEQRRAARACS